MPRCLVIQHDPDGPVGLAGERLVEHGYDLDVLPVMRAAGVGRSEAVFPSPLSYDFVVSTGSVQAVYDREAIGGWIDDELDLLRTAHHAGIPVLGLCFGGQALAAALGGVVEHAPYAEIGWITLDSDDPELISPGPWFAWHVDRFTVPPGAVEIARSALCPHAFQIGRSLGLQFHPEVDRSIVQSWSDSCPDEYFTSKDLEKSLIWRSEAFDRARVGMFGIIDRMVDPGWSS